MRNNDLMHPPDIDTRLDEFLRLNGTQFPDSVVPRSAHARPPSCGGFNSSIVVSWIERALANAKHKSQ